MNKIIVSMVFGAVSLVSCTKIVTAPSTSSASAVAQASSTSAPAAMSTDVEVTLAEGELFVVISAQQKAETEELLEAYFARVFPAAAGNGFRPLAQLPIDDVAAGEFAANTFVGLFAWPNGQAVQAFLQEVSAEELDGLRRPIWSELKQHVVMVASDVSFTLDSSKVTEVRFLAADAPSGRTALQEQVAQHGGEVVYIGAVSAYEDLGNGTAPGQVAFVAWTSRRDADAYRQSQSHSSSGDEAFYTHLEMPQ